MRAATFFAGLALAGSSLAASVTVSGVTDGQVGVRREISELSGDSLDLYLLAMKRYVESDVEDKLSFFQIGGIHGLPCAPYDDVGNGEGGGCGYCTHSSNLFPAWHRAYNALYEQGFYQQVLGVIDDFAGNPAQQAAFQSIASGFRMPYWDWAANPTTGEYDVPAILTQAQVQVPSPNGGSQNIDNPVYSYRFQVFDNSVTGGQYPWTNWQNTLRWPANDETWSWSETWQLSDSMKGAFSSIQDLTYNMLLSCTTWDEMSNDQAATSSPNCAAGLESIHDQVHVRIGGNGHMSDLGHASFDPIFWLHHTNVDRLLALWQVTQDNTWYNAGSSGSPTFTQAGNQWADGNWNLAPFYKDAGSGAFLTPNDLADWTAFGYTYSEVQGGLGTNKDSVIAAINRIYGTAPPQDIPPTPPPSNENNNEGENNNNNEGENNNNEGENTGNNGGSNNSGNNGGSNNTGSGNNGGSNNSGNNGGSNNNGSPSTNPRPSGNGTRPYPSARPSSKPVDYKDLTPLPSYLPDLLTPLGRTFSWAVSIVAERMGLKGSFSVYVFFGDVPADSTKWDTASNLVGSHGFFSSSEMDYASNASSLVSGAVSLTVALVKKIGSGDLKGLDAIVVEPYLQKNLNWAVKKCDGTVISNDAVPGLEVTVVLTKVVPPKSIDAAPKFEQPKTYDNVTSGAAGGYNGNDYYHEVPSYSPGTGSSGSSGNSGASGSWNYGGSSGSGSPAAPGTCNISPKKFGDLSCMPQVKYVYEYVYV